jgi:hypothetical protein
VSDFLSLAITSLVSIVSQFWIGVVQRCVKQRLLRAGMALAHFANFTFSHRTTATFVALESVHSST